MTFERKTNSNRLAAATDSSMLDEINHQKKVINPKVLESWINDTLSEAESMGVAGAIVVADKKPPLA